MHESLKTMEHIRKFGYEFSIYLNLLFNSIVFIDLYLTIKNPFYPREQRAKVYWAVVAVVIILFCISFHVQGPVTADLDFEHEYTYMACSIFLAAITVLSIVLVVFRLC